ncbi:MAG: TetR/AcrR family transcriptional regulator [Bacteroidetes bacterium]|nr:TetR/AcrR family transcriptional regulator [Bacteroidota bacterium]
MVKLKKDATTEEKILAAAQKIFVKKGMAGARMQEIADEAGINKAMLHYYFRNKEMLFEMIFRQSAQKLFPRLNIIFESDAPLFEKIEKFVSEYIDVIRENPYLPMFVLGEMNRNPEGFYKKMKYEFDFPKPDRFLQQIKKDAKEGKIKPIRPPQLLMNIISGTIFPFMARPMFQMHIGLSDAQFMEFIDQRKTEYARFIIDAIKK